MRTEHHKLVRDLIPQIIREDGLSPVVRLLGEDDYRAALREKLVEEAGEARDAPAGQLLAELADLVEVIEALLSAYQLTWEDLVALAGRKRSERGGFTQKIFLEYVADREAPVPGADRRSS
ncbi:nucleotide pyrophosphohydrolase [Streptomyces albus subsp. chlorinus]|uniref:nucleoside triphosphate pyrophosphohydrolase n=1 Tax=Streptomyces albus TaxID=1888 RepID=UPI00156F36B1|nr:nucleoside triphosphate pyrophosphohydrolase [Streptomyces albus]NSC25206.1 nucleotide pyrophosphohydrolase [Streptomyces albus subsp. chlorinus]